MNRAIKTTFAKNRRQSLVVVKDRFFTEDHVYLDTELTGAGYLTQQIADLLDCLIEKLDREICNESSTDTGAP